MKTKEKCEDEYFEERLKKTLKKVHTPHWESSNQKGGSPN